MPPMTRAFALVLMLLAAQSLADRDDHDRARRALERGEVLPLARILAVAEAEAGGRAIEVEFEREDGRWIYELELITPAGRLVELEIDAATGAILDREYDDDDDAARERDD
ncbi:peptidase [Rhodosalinus halophilus]|uniref:Peptidase n=1 Tax=Rhodosalinus halophilus TaxID=2259333 RepID=A0A365U6B2_9RHOB|nr:PepSY domain-containing protein [Rhodosalinus halophilus]RBI83788.1 peptidase [Rhodosalinus halophilus]